MPTNKEKYFKLNGKSPQKSQVHMYILGARESNTQMREGGTPLCTEEAGEEGVGPRMKC